MSARVDVPQPGSPLTMRELEATTLAAEGLTYDEIAARMFVSKSWVHSLLMSARHRLDAKNSVHLVHRAHQVGCLSVGDVDAYGEGWRAAVQAIEKALADVAGPGQPEAGGQP